MNSALHKIDRCEVCGSTDLHRALDLGNHPMCDDLVQIGDTRTCKEYPIEISFCEKCITGHQTYQIPKRELFPSTYHYRSRHTADVLAGMKDLVLTADRFLGGLFGKTVLDIGCNDGSLLSFFHERGALTYGIEPTGAAKDAKECGHTVVNEFLSEESAKRFVLDHGRPDIITFTNVFAHIEDLDCVTRSLKLLAKTETTIIIENHYLGAILETNQFDTFYHEHPRTYSYSSFCHIADTLQMGVSKLEFPKRYGGNIRVFLTSLKSGSTAIDRYNGLHEIERNFGKDLARLSSCIAKWQANKRASLEAEVARHGKLKAKAFPGRAAIPIKMLGLDETFISAVYEKPGSAKIGHYVPGTRIPIYSDDEFSVAEMGAAPLINLAWHISSEIASYMRLRGYTGSIVDIISREDFK